MKKCYKCQQTKQLDEFYNCKREKDGKQQKCKNCFKIWQKSRNKTDKVQHNLDDLELQKIILADYKNGDNPRDTAKKYKIARSSIYTILKNNGIDTSNQNQRRKYKIKNENYFDKIDSEDKAYFLGLLWADGCNFRRDGKGKSAYQTIITLQEGDKHILENLCLRFYDDISILKYINKQNEKDGCNRKNQWTLRVPSKHISDKLLEHGMMPKKSFIVEWPNNLPSELNRHFIRGYLDGDGSIFFNKARRREFCGVSFIGSLSFNKSLVEKIKENLSIYVVTNIRNNYTFPMSDVRVHGNENSEKLLDWLYKDSTIYLNRKFERYQKLKKLRIQYKTQKFSRKPKILTELPQPIPCLDTIVQAGISLLV